MGYRHRRALLTPARVISPSRCQQPPHDVNDPLTVPTTRVHTRGSTRARAGHAADTADNARCPGGAPALRPSALRTRSTWTRPTTPTAQRNTRTRARPQEDCSGSYATPSEYAHKDPDSRNTHRTQGRNQALVRGPVLRNSLPCVRHQRTRTPKKDGAKEQTHQPTANPNQQTGQPAKKGTVNRMGPARTTWGAAPAAPPYGSGFTARCRATTPPVRLRYWTSDQPLRAIMAPRARWSGHWRIDSTK